MVHDDRILSLHLGRFYYPAVEHVTVRGGELEELPCGHAWLVDFFCQNLVVYEGLQYLALHVLNGDDVGCVEI